MLADGLGTFFSSVHAEDRKPVRLPLAVWPTAWSGSPHRSCDCLLLSAHGLVNLSLLSFTVQSIVDTPRK